MTTQARLGARAILLMTPAFLVLVVLSDPRAAAATLTDPGAAFAVGAGLVLQGVGAMWIGAIVSSVARAGPPVTARVPVLRAVHALIAGRVRTTIDDDVAEVCDVVALALDAGLSSTAAVEATTPFVRGPFGDAIRAAMGSDAPHRELVSTCMPLGSDSTRFARAVEASVDLGVPLAPALRSLARDVRRSSAARSAEDVRRASVRVLVPLAGLVLPAFVLACLVPMFVGGLRGIAT